MLAMNEKLLSLLRQLSVPDQALSAIDEQAYRLALHHVDAMRRGPQVRTRRWWWVCVQRRAREGPISVRPTAQHPVLSDRRAPPPGRNGLAPSVRRSLFERDGVREREEYAVLAKNGYVVSSHMLPAKQDEQIKSVLGNFAFGYNDDQNVEMLDSELLARIPSTFDSDIAPVELARLTQNYNTSSQQRFAAVARQRHTLLQRLVDKVVRHARSSFA